MAGAVLAVSVSFLSARSKPSSAPELATNVLLVTVPPSHAAIAPVLPSPVLLSNVLLVTVSVPEPSQSPMSMAPPSEPDELLTNEELATTRLPVRSPSPIHPSAASIAPPVKLAEFWVNVSPLTVSVPVPRSSMAPPAFVGSPATPPLTIMLSIVTAPALTSEMVMLLPEPPSSRVGWVEPVPSMTRESLEGRTICTISS